MPLPFVLLVLVGAGLPLHPVDTGVFPRGGGAYGATLLDADGDGALDIFLSRHSDRPYIFLTRPDLSFVPCEEPNTPPLRDHHGSNAFDLDGDGRPEVYLPVGAKGGAGEGYNGLWTRADACTFENLIEPSHALADARGRGRGSLWLDADGDGRPELLVFNHDTPARYFERSRSGWTDLTDLLNPPKTKAKGGVAMDVTAACAGDLDGQPGMEVMVAGRQGFLLTHVDGVLRDVAARWGLGGRQHGVRQPVMADLDGDGDLDVLLGRVRRVDVFRNQDQRLEVWTTLSLPNDGGRLVGMQAADVDNDGALDLLIARNRGGSGDAPNLIALGDAAGGFEIGHTFAAAKSPSTCAWAVDLDHDGDLDPMAVQGFGSGGPGPVVEVFRNDVPSAGITLYLEGASLGTRVELNLSTGKQVARVRSRGNPVNAAVLPVHFGVGRESGPFRVRLLTDQESAPEWEIPRSGAAYRLGRAGVQVLTIP